MTLAFIIVLPMPLYGSRYIFSKPFFRLWVVWTFAWAWAAGLVITILPLWQGRHTLRLVFSHMFSYSTSALVPGSPTSGTEKHRNSEEEDEKKDGKGGDLTRVSIVSA